MNNEKIAIIVDFNLWRLESVIVLCEYSDLQTQLGYKRIIDCAVDKIFEILREGVSKEYLLRRATIKDTPNPMNPYPIAKLDSQTERK